MIPTDEVEAWLRQATADFEASLAVSDHLRECHARYWLQQAYEKAVKAYGLLAFEPQSADDRAQLAHVFLRHHTPFKKIDAADPVSKVIYTVQRAVRQFVNTLPCGDVLRKIDETRPEFDPSVVSYRYPFQRLEDPSFVAPAEFDGWDGYQGGRMQVEGAVRDLLRAVRQQLKTRRRGPP